MIGKPVGLVLLGSCVAAVLGMSAILSACSSAEMSDSESGSAPGSPNGMPGKSDSDNQGSSPDAAAELPPEKEVESAYEYPTATDRFIWVANPLSGRVAYIDATSLVVKTTQAGHAPTYLAAVPDPNTDTAIVANVRSADATILRADAAGTIESSTVPIAQGANAWAVEPHGQWAIAWSDYRLAGASSTTQGFQDVAVINLTRGQERSTRLSVGYRPVAIHFSADNAHAYVVTQDGVSVVDLAASNGPTVSGLVPVSDDPMEDPGTRDVSITPDGKYALIRRDGSKSISIVDLGGSKRTDVVLAGPVTDLDLSPDGTRAVAVVREASEAVVLPLPQIVDDPSVAVTVKVTDAIVGSVSMAANAAVALLYSNASDQEKIVRFEFGTESPSVRAMRLHAPVLGVFLSKDGNNAIVLHNQIPGEADAGSPYVEVPGAFSALRMSPDFPAKLQATLAQPVAVALSSDGELAVVAERDESKKIYGAYLVRMATQRVDRYDFGSPPISVGVLATAKRAYVAQKHPEGRVTFIDLDSGRARTLTGFELAARVVDGPAGK